LLTRIMARSAKAATSAIAIRRTRSSPADGCGAKCAVPSPATEVVGAMVPLGSSGYVFQRVLGTRLELLAGASARYGVDSAVRSATMRTTVGTQKRLLSCTRFISGSP